MLQIYVNNSTSGTYMCTLHPLYNTRIMSFIKLSL